MSSTIENRDGRPRLMINGVEKAPLIYGLTDSPGSRWTWEEMPARNIAVFASNGVKLFLADIWFEQMIGEDDQLDVTLARKQVAGVLEQCTDAAVMLRVHVNAPQWWLDHNPGEMVGYADAELEPEQPWSLQRPLAQDAAASRRASFSSKLWLDWATTHLQSFCRELSASEEGASVFGIQISNGVYGEWHQFGFIQHDPDTGVASQAAFREWLKNRYIDEASMNTAWGENGLMWESVSIPDSASREVVDCGVLRDPAKRGEVIDYFQFQHEKLAEVIINLSETVRESWSRPVITATFFGYFHNLFGRHASGGHLAMDRILASPHIDCLCGPQSYDPAARQMGGTGHARGLIDPVRRSGKLWLDEMDQPTTVSGCAWDPSAVTTLDDDVAVQIRNILQPVTRGVGAWWYDFGMTCGTTEAVLYGAMGWWDHPRLQQDVQRLAEIVHERLARPHVRAADVLVVHDPWSFTHTGSRRATDIDQLGDCSKALPIDPVSPIAIDALTTGLYQSGLVHEEALLSELSTIDLSAFRMVIFATTPVLDEPQREIFRDRVAKDGRHVVFTGYAGWSDGSKVEPELATQLTGFETQLLNANPAVQSVTLDGTEDVCELGGAFDVPAFNRENVSVVGLWKNGRASAVTLVEEDATWWSFAVAPSQPSMLREMGRRAGCHITNECYETTMVGAGLLVVHTLTGGPRTLKTPEGIVIEADLPERCSVVFDAVTGERLLG